MKCGAKRIQYEYFATKTQPSCLPQSRISGNNCPTISYPFGASFR